MNLDVLKSEPGAEPVVVEAIFRTTADRLYQAWTDPDELLQWFGKGDPGLATADIDLRVGGQWRFAFGQREGRQDALRGEYLAIEQGRRLVFSWIHERTFADGNVEASAQSQVSVTFEPRPGGTFVRLVHEAIVERDSRLGVGRGWTQSFARLFAVFGGTSGSGEATA
ncbi:MAG: SRPBCC domain-containing protein [Pseudomonadota bacterium]